MRSEAEVLEQEHHPAKRNWSQRVEVGKRMGKAGTGQDYILWRRSLRTSLERRRKKMIGFDGLGGPGLGGLARYWMGSFGFWRAEIGFRGRGGMVLAGVDGLLHDRFL